MMVGSRFLVVIEVQDCVLHALSTLKQWHSFFCELSQVEGFFFSCFGRVVEVMGRRITATRAQKIR